MSAFAEALREGTRQLARGQTANAQQHARAALRLQPGNPQAQHLMGLAFFRERQYGLAYEIFNKLSERNDDSSALHINAGLAALYGNRAENALRHLQLAIGLAPGHKRAFAHLGLLHLAAGDLELARAALAEAKLDKLAREVEAGADRVALEERVRDALATLPAEEGLDDGFIEVGAIMVSGDAVADGEDDADSVGKDEAGDDVDGDDLDDDRGDDDVDDDEAGIAAADDATHVGEDGGSASEDPEGALEDDGADVEFEAELPEGEGEALEFEAELPSDEEEGPARGLSRAGREPIADRRGARRRMVSGEIIVDAEARRQRRTTLPGVVSGEIAARRKAAKAEAAGEGQESSPRQRKRATVEVSLEEDPAVEGDPGMEPAADATADLRVAAEAEVAAILEDAAGTPDPEVVELEAELEEPEAVEAELEEPEAVELEAELEEPEAVELEAELEEPEAVELEAEPGDNELDVEDLEPEDLGAGELPLADIEQEEVLPSHDDETSFEDVAPQDSGQVPTAAAHAVGEPAPTKPYDPSEDDDDDEGDLEFSVVSDDGPDDEQRAAAGLTLDQAIGAALVEASNPPVGHAGDDGEADRASARQAPGPTGPVMPLPSAPAVDEEAQEAARALAARVAAIAAAERQDLAPLTSGDLSRHTLSQQLLPALIAGERVELRRDRLYLRFGRWTRERGDWAAIIRDDRTLLVQGRLDGQAVSRRSRGMTDEPFIVAGQALRRVGGDALLVADPAPGHRFELFWLGAAQLLYLREDLLYGFSATLHWENGHLPGEQGPAMVRLSGEGMVVVHSSGVACCPVREQTPARVRPSALAGWLGDLVVFPQGAGDDAAGGVCSYACEGKGTVLVSTAEPRSS